MDKLKGTTIPTIAFLINKSSYPDNNSVWLQRPHLKSVQHKLKEKLPKI